MSDFRNINPVTFFYEHDYDLIVNQNRFSTQQGLDLNLVNALSGLKDETILNYSDIFLSKAMSVNDVVYLPNRGEGNIVFSTFLGLSSLSGVNNNTRYVQLSSSPTYSLSAGLNFTKILSNTEDTYFAFQALNGLQCRITSIKDNLPKNLTIDLESFECSFTVQTPNVTANNLDIFEYSIDPLGYMKLFFRTDDHFYILRENRGTLSAVEASTTSSLSTDIFQTTFTLQDDINFKNNFIYYDKNNVKNFYLNLPETISDVPQNHVLFYNYQSKNNFLSGGIANIDFFKTKNVLSDQYYINDKLPFKRDDVVQRDYTTILSKQNSETYNGDLQFNYNFYTKEYLLLPDVTTKFTLPDTLYPYNVLNVDDSNLVNAGSYGGLSPVFSDKIIKRLNPNLNVVNYNEANGIYLYTWLYTDTNLLTSYWVDRYYFPKKTSINVAYSGSNNQIFNYTSELSSYLNTNYPADNYMYYDIRSSLTLEPSASYLYSRIGEKYINKVVDTFQKAVTGFDYLDNNVSQEIVNNLDFDGSKYGAFKLSSDLNNSFTLSFDLNSSNKDEINSNLLVGNNFDEGISLYKGGLKNIFTPGYFINSLTGVDFFDSNNLNTFSLNVSTYVQAPTVVLDIINTGFDHLIKIFYVRTDTNVPGFLDFSIYDKVFNKYEFNSLNNVFRTSSRINLFGKTYVGKSEIWYLVKDTDPANGARIYRFDYLNNTVIGAPATFTPASTKNFINSIVSKDDSLATTASLSGFDGCLLEDFIGISKLYNTVYFRNLSSGPTVASSTQYPTLCTIEGGVFDVAVLGDKFYVLTNTGTTSYDKYKRAYNTYVSNSSAVSGIKIDFINENYETKLITYTADINGKIIVDKFNIDTAELENSFNTGIKVDPIFFKEFQYPVRGKYTSLNAIGIVNNSFISGGFANEYTYSTPFFNSLTAFSIDAILAGISDNVNVFNSSLSGTIDCYGVQIPSDLRIYLFQNSTLVATASSDGTPYSLSLTYNNISKYVPYSLVCSRKVDDTIVVRLGLEINGGSFYNGAFRNVVVGSALQPPSPLNQGFANALFGSTNNSLTDQYGFVEGVSARKMDQNFAFVTPADYLTSYNLNGSVASNPYQDFYHYKENPHLRLVANPSSSTTFQPCFLTFNSEEDPPSTSNEIISGAPFQVPTNFATINTVNKFSEGDAVARIDLFSGNNYLNKQTEIVPFDIDNECQITMSFDVNNGFLRIYKDAELLKNVSLSAETFYTSYFLNNNFGVGMPFINNKAASTIGLSYNDYPQNYSINNFIVYDRPLNVDEVRFNFLKNKKIDPVNFDITSGTRNDTDTVTSFNKMVIPGRKNNDVIIYIKNAFLTEAGKAQLSSQLIEKVKNILPLNTGNIEFRYINYESD